MTTSTDAGDIEADQRVSEPGPVLGSGLIRDALSRVAAAVGGSIVLLIPSILELKAANWDVSYALTVAQIVSPPELGLRLLVVLFPGIAIGLVVGFGVSTLLVQAAEGAAWLQSRRVPINAKRPRRRDSVTGKPTWTQVLALSIPLVVPVFVLWLILAAAIGVGVAAFLGAPGTAAAVKVTIGAAMFAIGVDIGVRRPRAMRLDAVKDRGILWRGRAAGVVCAGIGLAVVLATTTAFPQASFTLYVDGVEVAVTGQVLDTTSDGAWLLTDAGRPVFYAVPLGQITIEG